MRTPPRRIRAALSPEIHIIWTIAQPVRSTMVPSRFVADVDAAAHTRLGTGVAWLVRDAGGTVLCHVGAVLEVTCCG